MTFFLQQKTPLKSGVFLEKILSSNKWNQSHESRVLHGEGEFALVLCARASLLAGGDARVWVQELLEKLRIFVVDMFDII